MKNNITLKLGNKISIIYAESSLKGGLYGE